MKILWAIGLVISPPDDISTYLGFRKLPMTDTVFRHYLQMAEEAQYRGLYRDFMDTCILNADDRATQSIIEQLSVLGFLPNANDYLAWFRGVRGAPGSPLMS